MNHSVVQALTRRSATDAADRTDGQLLDLFIRQRDADAFAAVVRRHGPMVLTVCRRVLRNEADADDAFQAAFLVLARKAASLKRYSLLAPWLHGVAFNTARRLRRAIGRRMAREGPLADLPEPAIAHEIALRNELLAILDEELAALPEHYRAPVVLCDLEGLTRKEAARQLGCPEGTVAGRLARARDLLAARLANRGIVPSAGILAVLLTQRPISALTSTHITAAVSAAGGGGVSATVARTAERVVAAMFLRKLKTVAVAMLLSGIVTAVVAGLLGTDVNAGSEPAAPRTETGARPDAVKPPTGKANERILTVLQLKNLGAEDTASAIAEAYKGKGVTVAPIVGERGLLIYATEQVTFEIEGLVQKLGEDAPRKPGVIRLKPGTNATEVARSLTKQFPDATIIPIPDEGALLVYADHLTTMLLRVSPPSNPRLPDTKEPGKPAPEPKKYAFKMQNVPWGDVLDWYAQESGLTPLLTVKPKGTFTFIPPKPDKSYTLAEITDILNEALTQQKFLLVRRKFSFYIHPADEKIDPSWVPLVEVKDLSTRGKTELVQFLLPLKSLMVEEAAPEVKKLLSPFGSVSALNKTNTLLILDTAQNVRRVYGMIRAIEGENGSESLTHACKYKKAREVADYLKTQLVDPKPDKKVTIAVDEWANSVTLTGPPDRIVTARKIIAEFDKGTKPLLPSEPELRKYSVPPGTAEAIAESLQALNPELRIVAVQSANEIWAMAAPQEHAKLAKTLEGLRRGAPGKPKM